MTDFGRRDLLRMAFGFVASLPALISGNASGQAKKLIGTHASEETPVRKIEFRDYPEIGKQIFEYIRPSRLEYVDSDRVILHLPDSYLGIVESCDADKENPVAFVDDEKLVVDKNVQFALLTNGRSVIEIVIMCDPGEGRVRISYSRDCDVRKTDDHFMISEPSEMLLVTYEQPMLNKKTA